MSPIVLQMCDLRAHDIPFRPVGAGQCDKPWISICPLNQ
jgi:hypothetical protein